MMVLNVQYMYGSLVRFLIWQTGEFFRNLPKIKKPAFSLHVMYTHSIRNCPIKSFVNTFKAKFVTQ